MKIIVLILSVISPSLATASFYENCLLIGQINLREQSTDSKNVTLKKVFVTTNSYTLAGSQRGCQYWHGREIDITDDKLSKLKTAQTVALHYTHESSLCENNQSCGSTQIKHAPYH